MLWVKALHIFFVMSWMAGVFYLPRIFVNLAMEHDIATRERLLLMARKLYRFMSILSGPAVLLGVWLAWLQYGPAVAKAHWLHAKFAVVVLLIGYHHACGSLLAKFENGANKRSHKWFRVFNEVPVFMLLAVLILVVVKPF
ncbi:CopD family protein [Oxalobacteraceae bacterium]|nr:CopD family protein [Oxalobacteraceae bacterium]